MQLTVEPVQTQMLVTASTNVQPCMMGHICIGALRSQCELRMVHSPNLDDVVGMQCDLYMVKWPK